MVTESPVSGTVILPNEGVNVSGLIGISTIDGNLLITGAFTVIALLVVALLILAWLHITATRDNMSPGAVNDILQSTFTGLMDFWRDMGDRVQETPTPVDDAAYYLANMPVEAIKQHLAELGFEVVPTKTDA